MPYNLTFFFFFLVAGIGAQTNILFTDFQKGIPSNYSIISNDGFAPDPSVSQFSSAWISMSNPEELTDTVAAATSFFSPIGKADRWLITPPLTLGLYGNTIEWEAKSQDESFPDDYIVLLSKTDQQLTSFKDTLVIVNKENTTWTKRTINLSERGYNNQTVYVAFRLTTYNGFMLYLDDIACAKDDPASTTELAVESTINFFPNPSSDVLHIQTNKLILSCIVHTLSGEKVAESNSKTIRISDLKNGVYLLTVLAEKEKRTFRFVKN